MRSGASFVYTSVHRPVRPNPRSTRETMRGADVRRAESIWRGILTQWADVQREGDERGVYNLPWGRKGQDQRIYRRGHPTPAARQASDRTQRQPVTDFILCLEFASATTRSGSPSGSVSSMARNLAAMTVCRVATGCRPASAIRA